MLCLERIASNETTLLTSSLIEKMEVEDLRYNVSFACGNVLRDIPQRLGSDPALDAAAGAFAISLPCVLTRRRSPQMLKKYGLALSRLRTSLDDPGRARNASTVCAIYLVWVCQVSISPLLEGHSSVWPNTQQHLVLDRHAWRRRAESWRGINAIAPALSDQHGGKVR